MNKAIVKPIRHFIVLGAGASYGARKIASWAIQPPVGNRLAQYLHLWLENNDPSKWDIPQRIQADDMYDKVYPCLCQAFKDRGRRERLIRWLIDIEDQVINGHTGFEEALTKIWLERNNKNWKEANELVHDINQILCLSLTNGVGCAFQEGVDLFDQLLQQGTLSGDDIAIITLNYDILLEEALHRSRGSYCYWYPGLRGGQQETEIPIFKIHGSCNWLVQSGSATSSTFSVAQKNAVPLTLGPENTLDSQREYAVIEGGRNNLIAHLKHQGDDFNPIMALYMPRKAVPSNWPAVDNVRKACFETIKVNQKASVTVIGLHIPSIDDDTVLHNCLAMLGKLKGERIFVNPDKCDNTAAAMMGFSTKELTFLEFINQ